MEVDMEVSGYVGVILLYTNPYDWHLALALFGYPLLQKGWNTGHIFQFPSLYILTVQFSYADGLCA